MKSARFWAVILLLIGALALVRLRGDTDFVPPSDPLSEMPRTLGPWSSTEVALDPRVIGVLGKGIFLDRVYTPQAAPASATVTPAALVVAPPDQGPIGLFIGYFPTQRSGQSIHSPQNCLPGAGWSFDSSGTIAIPGTAGPMQVGNYVISNGASRAVVLYWYQSHGRSIANDYKAKFYMLTDSIRLRRTDAALVRIVAPVDANESIDQARARALLFASNMAPLLPRFIPN